MGVNGERVDRGQNAHAARLMRAAAANGIGAGIASSRHVVRYAAAGDDRGVTASSAIVDAVGIVVHRIGRLIDALARVPGVLPVPVKV